MNRSSDRQRLQALLTERSVQVGDFTLSSGARSTYYVDARLTTMSAEGQALVGRVGYEAIRGAGWDPTHVGGLTLGADPVSYAIAHHSWVVGAPIDAYTVRKEAKVHGTGKRIEGGLPANARVVVIEDAITSGASALDAVSAVRDHGVRVLGVFCLVDRDEGGRERIEAAGCAVVAAFLGPDLRTGALAL
ncbi:MAG: orotate phosphoribosyltransferase [Gemmatimonadota bacterium]|nr:MAG: orotate phosphoribosyltransferase [Gemmatimonadota bacterium]